MITINMLSKADTVKGQGVGSAYLEQVNLVKEDLHGECEVTINRIKRSNITHYHTINLEYYLSIPFTKKKGTTVGYVHFLPETLEGSIQLPGWMKKIFYRYVIDFYNKMDMLVTVNPSFIDKLEQCGIDRSKVTYIPNFVSDKEFYPAPSQKAAFRKKYNLPENRFTVLAAGQLQKRKGVLDFIELARRMPEVSFVWAGDFSFGKISDGYEEIVKARKEAPKNVYFLGMVEREDMNGIYNMADVMILPSFSELFPMTILEAMSCGVPILLRDLDIYPDILFDFYLKAGTLDEFEHILTRMEHDDDFYHKAEEMSKRGNVFYSREHVAQMWRSFYAKAVEYKIPAYQKRTRMPSYSVRKLKLP